jgi:putative transposase
VGATVMVMANVDSVRDTWRGTAGSSPITWGIWSVLGFTALLAQLSIGGWTAAAVLLVPVFGVATAVAAGAIARYRSAEPGAPWQYWVDLSCGVLAALSFLVLLFLSDRAALIMTIVTDALAAIPTITMAWWPSRERPVPTAPFISVAVSALCTLAATPPDLYQRAYPLYLVVLGVTMTGIIIVRRNRVPEVISLDPRVPKRPAPNLLAEATTRQTVPPWARSPHAAALHRLVPPDLMWQTDVPAWRVVAMTEHLYTAGHRDGWRERGRVEEPPPASMGSPTPRDPHLRPVVHVPHRHSRHQPSRRAGRPDVSHPADLRRPSERRWNRSDTPTAARGEVPAMTETIDPGAGSRTTMVRTGIAPVHNEVPPRDRDAGDDPVTVRKRLRRLDGIDEVALSLTARGLTTGEVAAHFDEVYGAKVCEGTVSRITGKAFEEMGEWQNRPLDAVYPVIFVDALRVKVGDGRLTDRPFSVVIGVTVDGRRDILGIWAGEGAMFWLQVFTELKDRGVDDVCMAVCDGLEGLPEAITTTWAQTVVETCAVHLIRKSFRYASRRCWERMAKDLRAVYTAPTEAAAEARFTEFADTWGARYPAIIALWRSAWSDFVPLLDFDVEIRKVICSTNAIERLNARYRRAIKARGHFPTEQAAMDCLYLVTRSLDPAGKGRARWAVRWKPALNAFAITFAGRVVPANGS